MKEDAAGSLNYTAAGFLLAVDVRMVAVEVFKALISLQGTVRNWQRRAFLKSFKAR